MTTTTIYTGVTSDGLTVNNGDHLIILSAGTADNTTIAGGSATMSSGAIFDFGYVSAGAVLSGPGSLESDIFDSGTVTGVIVGTISSAGVSANSGYLFVESGGVASNATVRNGFILIESGGSAFGDIISVGAVESVNSSGTVSGTRVLSGGIERLDPGFAIEASTVSSGGYLELSTTVTAGQTFVVSGKVSATTTIDGATLLSGAVVAGDDDVVSASGVLSLAAGALVDVLTISSGGVVRGSGALVDQVVVVGGSASGATIGQVGNFTDVYLESGSGSGLTVANGVVIVYSGATVSGDIVSSAGSQYILSSGTDTGGTILSGGVEIEGAGAILQAVMVSGGGALEYAFGYISSGVTFVASGTAHATSTYSGATLVSGASLDAYEETVLSSGVLSLGAGALGIAIYVESSGTAVGDGDIVGMTYDSGFISGVGVGGVAGSSGTIDIDAGGIVSGLSIGASGVVNAFSGAADGDLISSGGTQVVFDGATASATTVSAGGVEVVSSAGTATSDTVSAGGVVSVVSGGVVEDASVDSGGRLYLAAGAIVDTALIFPGGTLEVQSLTVSSGQTSAISKTYAAGSLSGVTLAGAALIVDQATVSSGGVLSLATGVVMSDVIIDTGGVLLGPGEVTGVTPLVDNLLVSGIALGDTHGGHASLQVMSGAYAISVGEAGAGDVVTVSNGGSAVATVDTGSGAALVVDAGGHASATTLRTGANAQVFGSAAGTHVSSGAVEFVESGGVAAGIVVLGGGLESILSGGTTSIVTISSGGAVSVAAGGKLREATEIAGGSIVVSGDAIWQGTATYTLKGALSGKGDIYADGPGTLVLSGTDTAFGGEAIISGGVIELASASGLGTAKLEFGAGSTKKTLKIDAADRPASGGTFATTLIDFDSSSATYVDLTGLAFVTGATATLSGTTLTLKDGTYTAKFTLSGEGASKYSVFSDGAGGTEFRAATGSTQMPLLVHAIATFGPGGGASHLASPLSGGASPPTLMAADPAARGREWA